VHYRRTPDFKRQITSCPRKVKDGYFLAQFAVLLHAAANLYHPSSVRLLRSMPEFTYPKGPLLRGVNNIGDIS